MRPRRGEFDEHVEVTGRVWVQGALLRGATVHAGGVLAVQGLMAGRLRVEGDGVAHVEGTFESEIDGDGVTMIAGVVRARLPRQRGVVLVAPGTLFTTGPWPAVLMEDGTFERLPDSHPGIGALADRGHLRLTPQGAFVAVAA